MRAGFRACIVILGYFAVNVYAEKTPEQYNFEIREGIANPSELISALTNPAYSAIAPSKLQVGVVTAAFTKQFVGPVPGIGLAGLSKIGPFTQMSR